MNLKQIVAALVVVSLTVGGMSGGVAAQEDGSEYNVEIVDDPVRLDSEANNVTVEVAVEAGSDAIDGTYDVSLVDSNISDSESLMNADVAGSAPSESVSLNADESKNVVVELDYADGAHQVNASELDDMSVIVVDSSATDPSVLDNVDATFDAGVLGNGLGDGSTDFDPVQILVIVSAGITVLGFIAALRD